MPLRLQRKLGPGAPQIPGKHAGSAGLAGSVSQRHGRTRTPFFFVQDLPTLYGSGGPTKTREGLCFPGLVSFVRRLCMHFQVLREMKRHMAHAAGQNGEASYADEAPWEPLLPATQQVRLRRYQAGQQQGADQKMCYYDLEQNPTAVNRASKDKLMTIITHGTYWSCAQRRPLHHLELLETQGVCVWPPTPPAGQPAVSLPGWHASLGMLSGPQWRKAAGNAIHLPSLGVFLVCFLSSVAPLAKVAAAMRHAGTEDFEDNVDQ